MGSAVQEKRGTNCLRHVCQKTFFVLYTYYLMSDELVRKGPSKGKKIEYVHYDLAAFDSSNGQERWLETRRGRSVTPTSAHCFDLHHPAIIKENVYVTVGTVSGLNIHEIATGKKSVVEKIRGGKYCGQISASQTGLYYRKGSTQMYSLKDQTETPISTVSRPACFINMLPAGGLLLLPESTAGCNCGFPLQTSFALFPHEEK